MIATIITLSCIIVFLLVRHHYDCKKLVRYIRENEMLELDKKELEEKVRSLLDRNRH